MATQYEELKQPASVDSRIISEISRSPRMRAEQPTDWLSQYGGPETYVTMMRMPVNPRVVYAAVLDGYTTSVDIEAATGLTSGEVSTALTYLQNKDLIDSQEVI